MPKFSNQDIERFAEGIGDLPGREHDGSILEPDGERVHGQPGDENLPYELYRGQGGWVIIYRDPRDGSTDTVASGLDELNAKKIAGYLNGYHR